MRRSKRTNTKNVPRLRRTTRGNTGTGYKKRYSIGASTSSQLTEGVQSVHDIGTLKPPLRSTAEKLASSYCVNIQLLCQ